MKNNIFTVMKKELLRFFGDRRMLLAIFLPGVLIYLIYTLMGDAMMSGLMPDEETSYTVQIEELPESVEMLLTASSGGFSYVTVEDPMTAVANQELDLYVVFPADFDAKVAALEVPGVELYYHSASMTSSTAYSLFTSLLDGYESMLANRFDVNADLGKTYDLASAEDTTGMLFSMLMPMLLIMLMFSGCMAVAPESIAGEKERGTIATLLVTPIRRSELAIGKIAALSIISLLSGLCSFFGVLFALPNLMGGEMDGMIDANIYGMSDYAWILGVILTTILVFVSLISILSALAASVKEASSMISPLMILVTLVGLSGMFGTATSTWVYFIPVYNSVQCISGIFSLAYQPAHIVITMVVNCVVAGIFVFVLTKLFNSERVMFKK
ncbi:MAG: ABC transporter permease [Clostridia bacterium]|nr:ABC transporter permease [Clostridia bacterium]